MQTAVLKISVKNMEKRAVCRKYYKDIRNAMSGEEVRDKSKRICENLLADNAYQTADLIMAYYPLGNEVDCLSVIERTLKEGKKIALPKTSECSLMDFYEITGLQDLEVGSFHIMEPNSACIRIEPEIYRQKKILVLVPGIVFDREGNRYGYGSGYYDRYFERYPDMKRMALAYKKQISEETLECLSTDVKMHVIITEDEKIKVKNR